MALDQDGKHADKGKEKNGDPGSGTRKPSNLGFSAIVLAAGQGTRMKSPLPKVLHPVAGRPMIERIVRAVQGAGASEVRLVVGHGQALVKPMVESLKVQCFEQKEQRGTAHAVRSAHPESLEGSVLILNGDHPLVTPEDLVEFMRIFNEEKLDLALVTAVVKKPGDLGRVVRQKGEIRAIVEARDASAETLKIKEVNAGIYILKPEALRKLLPKIKSENAKQEYYLTDLVYLAMEEGLRVQTILGKKSVAFGVNTQAELSRATQFIFRRKSQTLMESGVMVLNPKATYVEDSVKIGPGSVLYPNCFIRGKTEIGSFCVVEPHAFISECHLGDSVQIRAGSYLEGAEVKSRAVVGPYARLRPQADIGEEAQVGNFVEVKNATLGKKSKAAHLAYIGDAELGENCNVGCGTVFVNYMPNKEKHKTTVGDRVFVGSDVQLVAPLKIGDDAVLGAGSVITKDVPSGALAVTRAKQIIKENYLPKATYSVDLETEQEESAGGEKG